MVSPNQLPPGGPPYPPQTKSSGGVPDVIPDIPITAVFLLLYVILFAIHANIDRRNRKRNHIFIFSRAMLAFCVIRMATMSLRIVWSCNRRNVSIGIAAQIFVYVGTVILFIMNWLFAQRIIRAQHPQWGWSTQYQILHRGALALLICCLLMLITVALQSFFTWDGNIHRIDRDIQLAGLTYFAFFSFAPVVVVIINVLVPRHSKEVTGEGSMNKTILLLIFAGTILALGAAFRAGTAWLDPVPLRDSTPWYFSTACFYVFYFTTEIIVVMLYAWKRFDLRFWVPDGAKKPGDYGEETSPTFTDHVASSEATLHMYQTDIFSDARTLADSLQYGPSILKMDEKTGSWKVKRASSGSSATASVYSTKSRFSASTMPPNDIPTIPELPHLHEEVRNKHDSVLSCSPEHTRYKRSDALAQLTGSDQSTIDGNSSHVKDPPGVDADNESPALKNDSENEPSDSQVRSEDANHDFNFNFDIPKEGV